MWVTAHRGGNMGKEIHPKFQILDIRAKPDKAARSSVGQEPAKAAEAGEPLDNDGVVKMVIAGFKEDTIISVIGRRPGRYSVSNDSVAALRTAGVPESVIAAMAEKNGRVAQ
jgi:hypothetical protein